MGNAPNIEQGADHSLSHNNRDRNRKLYACLLVDGVKTTQKDMEQSTLLKYRSYSNPKKGVPTTGQIKLWVGSSSYS